MSDDAAAPKTVSVEFASIVSSRTAEGLVEMVVNGEKMQMRLTKAREILGMLSGAIEAAVSDELMFKFLTTRVDLSPDAAAAALLDFREMRQGSKSSVYPM